MIDISIAMASHLPSVKTFECEMKSLFKHLRSLDRCLVLHEVEIKNNELKFVFSTSNDPETYSVNGDLEVNVSGTAVELKTPELKGKAVSEIITILSKMITAAYEQKLLYQRERISLAKIQDQRLILQLEKVKEKKDNTTSKQKRLLLIDGANLLSRGYFATSFRGTLLQNQEGLYTNGVYVFIKKMFKLIKSFSVTHVVVCWDVSRSETFRRKIYPDYKGLRGDTEAELKQQFKTTEEALRMMNITQLKILPYEADDLIGALAEKWINTNSDGKCFVYSSDKDLFQLLDEEERIVQVISKNKEDVVYSWTSFEQDYGIKPYQWIDVKAILGETGKSSDNIPGCKGVGEKAALPLIQQYETLDGIYSNLNNLDQKFNRYRKKLEQGKESVELSKKLATIVRDIPEVPSTVDQFKLNINRRGLGDVFEWLNFRK